MPVENIKRFLEEAKKISQLPKEETDLMSIELNLEIAGFIRGLAAAWHCSVNDVLVASILAICNEEPQQLKDMILETK